MSKWFRFRRCNVGRATRPRTSRCRPGGKNPAGAGWGEKDRKRRDNARRRADVIWARHARSSDEPMTTFVTCLLLSFPKSVKFNRVTGHVTHVTCDAVSLELSIPSIPWIASLLSARFDLQQSMEVLLRRYQELRASTCNANTVTTTSHNEHMSNTFYIFYISFDHFAISCIGPESP